MLKHLHVKKIRSHTQTFNLTWKQWTKSHPIAVPLQNSSVSAYLFIKFHEIMLNNETGKKNWYLFLDLLK